MYPKKSGRLRKEPPHVSEKERAAPEGAAR